MSYFRGGSKSTKAFFLGRRYRLARYASCACSNLRQSQNPRGFVRLTADGRPRRTNTGKTQYRRCFSGPIMGRTI